METSVSEKGQREVGYGTSGLFWGVRPTQGSGWELKVDNSQGAALTFERERGRGKGGFSHSQCPQLGTGHLPGGDAAPSGSSTDLEHTGG